MRVLNSFSGTGNYTAEWTGRDSANSIAVSNDGAVDMTVTVHDFTITVKPNETLDTSFPIKFTEVGIVSTSAWRLLIGQ